MNDDSSEQPETTTYTSSEARLTAIRNQSLLDPTIEEWVTTHMYEYERQTPAFRFEHDVAKGVYRLTAADGTVEVFRDKPVRHLCVEPDEAGAMRPVVKHGQPVYLYLAREEREVR